MEKVKELLMRQMELLSSASETSADCLDDAYLAELSHAMAAIAAEIRGIERRPSRVEAKGANGEPLTF